MGLERQMGRLEPRNGPHATPTPSHGLSPRPTPPQGRTHSPVRSLVGHSNLPSTPCPSHDPPSIGPHFAPPPSCPHPHFWPELGRGNSSWQTRKAGMREIHKPDVLLWRGVVGDGGRKGRGALGAPVPSQHLFRAGAEGPGGAALLPRDQAAQGSWRDM